MPETLRILDSLAGIDAERLDALAPATRRSPTPSSTACTRAAAPRRARAGRRNTSPLWDGERLVGAAPLYVKSHSYGEYVFDWAWADAYERHGLDYYPKLLVRGAVHARDRAAAPGGDAGVRALLRRRCSTLAKRTPVSSLHVLFPSRGRARRCAPPAAWSAPACSSIGATRATPTSTISSPRLPRKRKKIRQERERCRRRREAAARDRREATRGRLGLLHPLLPAHLREHRSTPYLTREFFAPHRRADARQRAAGRSPSATASRSPRRSTCSDRRRSTGATGARSSTCPAFTSRRATTRRRVLHRARHRALRGRRPGRAQARPRLPPRATRSFHGSPIPPSTRAVDEYPRGARGTGSPATWTS